MDRDSVREMDSGVLGLDVVEKNGCDLVESVRVGSERDSADAVAFEIGSRSGKKDDGQEHVCLTPKNVRKEDHSGPSGMKNSQSKAKRKANDVIPLPSFDVSDENEESKCFITLRSGKKLLKKGLEEMYFDFRKAKHVNVSADEGFEDSRERIGEQSFCNRKLSLDEQSVNENGNAAHRSSSNKGKEKAMETEDTEVIKINRVEAGSKYKKKNLNANENQSSSSLSVTQKSVVTEKGKEKVNGREEGDDVGKMITNQRTDEIGILMERSLSYKKEFEEVLSALLSLGADKNQGEERRVMGEEKVRRVMEEKERRVMEEKERRVMEEEQRILKKLLRRSRMDYRGSALSNASALGRFYPENGRPNSSFSATRRVRDRAENAQEAEHSLLNDSEPASVMWVPKKILHNHSKPSASSLKELCMRILARNADSITSLDGIPDALRYRLSQLVCDFQAMDVHFFELLLRGSPTEICLHDCSQLTEDQFVKSFEGRDISNLTVLQLDHCGRCIPDYVLPSTLAPCSNSLPALTTLSLRGAYRLSDAGLRVLVSSAPVLKSINLSQCSLLSSSSIKTLAYSLGSSLRELHLSDCQLLDGTHILPAMKKFEQLEVLSLAGIESISDEFVKEFVKARGHHLKELFLRDCLQLTDSSLEVIAKTCSELCTLDLVNLCKLTDSSLGHLADGCCVIQKLKLRGNNFSDESIADYLEISGNTLEELSLNNIEQVDRNTALSLAKWSKKLVRLDLSWCRKMSDECVGLIADSCSSLKVLKLFGCTQITNVFLEGHSNPNLQIIGCQNGPVLAQMDNPEASKTAWYKYSEVLHSP